MSARWISVSATSAHYPTDHRGGGSTTSTDSAFAAGGKHARLHALVVTGQDASAAGTITLYDSDGTAILALPVPAYSDRPLSPAEARLELGGPDGWLLLGGFSAETSDADCSFVLFYDVEG